jgi:hypothetical protein
VAYRTPNPGAGEVRRAAMRGGRTENFFNAEGLPIPLVREEQGCYRIYLQYRPKTQLSPPMTLSSARRALSRYRHAPSKGRFETRFFELLAADVLSVGALFQEALEAAHLFGRDWRQGHNSAADGILLRRDLHNLYDRGLLRISEAGLVELQGDVLDYYEEYQGKAVTLDRS